MYEDENCRPLEMLLKISIICYAKTFVQLKRHKIAITEISSEASVYS